MLKKIKLKNLTVFKCAEISFSPGLNVIIGENGTGKTHILKAIYSVLSASFSSGRAMSKEGPSGLKTRTAQKLVNVFRPDSLGRLARRKQGREHCEIALTFDQSDLDCTLSFSTSSKGQVQFDVFPKKFQASAPVYFPTRELLTIYPNFVSLYDSHYLTFEETYRDTCELLGLPAEKGAKTKETQKLLSDIEAALGGKVVLDALGRFYLKITGQGTMEMPLVAEGLRKFAMAAQLVNNGALKRKSYFFWDEPECNLNPKLVKVVARVILNLCRAGIQVFIATHSLFLLRELALLSASREFASVKRKFIGLAAMENGTVIEEGESLDDIHTLTMLDEEIDQSERYLLGD